MELSCRRIIELVDKVMDGQEITRTEAMELIHTSDADTMVLPKPGYRPNDCGTGTDS